jgi:hypothetical protein
MTISLYDSESTMKKKVVTEEPKVTCIQCSKSKPSRHYKILRGKRRDVCDNCASKNAREVQTAKLRRECCPEGKMDMCGDATLINGDLKWCGACDTVHPIAEFKKGQKYKDGHASKCSSCVDGKLSIMSKAALIFFRNENSKAAFREFDDVMHSHNTMPDIVTCMDVLNVIDDAREITNEVKDAVGKIKSWWAKIKTKWNKWFK